VLETVFKTEFLTLLSSKYQDSMNRQLRVDINSRYVLVVFVKQNVRLSERACSMFDVSIGIGKLIISALVSTYTLYLLKPVFPPR